MIQIMMMQRPASEEEPVVSKRKRLKAHVSQAEARLLQNMRRQLWIELVTDIEAPHLLAATADALVHDIQELPPLSCSSPSSKDAIGLSGRVHNRPDE